jgi:membrane-associated phospholipid phosphatase
LQAIWVFLTNLGDSAVTVPLAVLTYCFFGARASYAWHSSGVLRSSAALEESGVLKLLLTACGPGLTLAGMLSPSGHAAMSTAMYGSLCLLIADRQPVAPSRSGDGLYRRDPADIRHRRLSAHLALSWAG